MKVILYMAITVNGMIAKKNNDTPWSNEELKSYFEHVKAAGNLIVGNKTLPLFWESDFADMGNPEVVVLTRNDSLKDRGKVKFARSAKEALGYLSGKGFKVVMVTGGGQTNAAFLETGLIDEIYLDVEPLIFGEGISLFSPVNTECKLHLLETKKLNDNTIQLHYKVIRGNS